MSKLTLRLNGQVPLDLFATAIQGFKSLISALTNEVAAGSEIEWVVVDLESGSASATVVGISNTPEAVERVSHAYDRMAESSWKHEPFPYPGKVEHEFHRITSVLNGKITEVVFEGEDKRAVVTSESVMAPGMPESQLVVALSSVEGVVQTLTSRKGLKFTLYDSVFDRSVVCHFSNEPDAREQQEEMMRGVWDKRAIVQGRVTRDPITGRPIEIRQITNVIPVIGSPDFRRARGAFKSSELPEAIIRRERDAG